MKMFYKVKIKDHIRVPPNLFGLDIKEAIKKTTEKLYEGTVSKEIGMVISVSEIESIGEGIIIPGDGAAYYETVLTLITYKPELKEVVLGKIKDIQDFGAFISIGPMEGMVHISQTMDDFVSFSKDKVLLGKQSKHSLKINDLCRARIIAISYKDINNPKIGLTMRQEGLGKLEWIYEEKKKPSSSEEEKESAKKQSKKK
ncbi:MAG: DNA-directed RNA polymerase [Candidatus Woesearchaeota archaeon]